MLSISHQYVILIKALKQSFELGETLKLCPPPLSKNSLHSELWEFRRLVITQYLTLILDLSHNIGLFLMGCLILYQVMSSDSWRRVLITAYIVHIAIQTYRLLCFDYFAVERFIMSCTLRD